MESSSATATIKKKIVTTNEKTVLSKEEEKEFEEWYAETNEVYNLGLDPNPDAPMQKYDYRGAFLAGALPDEKKHWPSEHKFDSHPNRFVGGVDTKVDPITEHHRKNVASGNTVKNADGTTSSVLTIIVGQTVNGEYGEYLFPTVWDGKIVSQDEAWRRAFASGTFVRFNTVEEAEAFDRNLHRKF